eukprot:g6488.t1
MMDVSSPDPGPFSFSRSKQPPAISSKPRSSRKVSSLFSSDTGDAASSNDAAGAATSASKRELGDESKITGGLLCAVRDHAASPPSNNSGGASGGTGFTSPIRACRESGATSSRFTPQRNLGGLFASPLPPPPPTTGEDEGGVTASPRGLTVAVPLLLQSPKRQEPPEAARAAAPAAGEREASCTPVDEAACTLTDTQSSVNKSQTPTAASPAAAPVTTATPSPVAALAPAPAPAPATTAVTPSCVAAVTAVTTTIAPAAAAAAPVAPSESSSVCQWGRSSSGVKDADCLNICCVSNEAFKDKGSKAMRTLEVLVKRERVGVSVLASWRVGDLKRRLVHLKFFPAAEVIALVPTFPLGSAALEDDVVLDTLDADVTYKARQVAVAAT